MERMLTEKQVATLLNINRATLSNWRSSGKGPKYVKVGGSIRYRYTDVELYLEKNSVETTGE